MLCAEHISHHMDEKCLIEVVNMWKHLSELILAQLRRMMFLDTRVRLVVASVLHICHISHPFRGGIFVFYVE